MTNKINNSSNLEEEVNRLPTPTWEEKFDKEFSNYLQKRYSEKYLLSGEYTKNIFVDFDDQKETIKWLKYFISLTRTEAYNQAKEEIEQVARASYMSMLDQKIIEAVSKEYEKGFIQGQKHAFGVDKKRVAKEAIKEREDELIKEIEKLKETGDSAKLNYCKIDDIINLIKPSTNRATMGKGEE